MIELQQVTKHFPVENGDPKVAVDGVSLSIKEGETLCLIGTSGCGKTTLLKLMNRLQELTSGSIQIDGEDHTSLDPIALRRKMGYVIQEGGLFPHMTIAQNIGLLCKLESWPEQKKQNRVDELMNLVNLAPDEFAPRYPNELSGGQRQRVGVARALALSPRYLLMDEPFGALDPITRESIHEEFLQLRKQVSITTVIVTHDLREASKLGDRVALMDHGKVVQCGKPEELVNQPANDFVRDFVKRMTLQAPSV